MDGITVTLSEGVRLSQISEANARLYGYKEADEVTTDFVMLECFCEKLQNLAGRQVENMVLMGKTLSEIRDSRTYRSCSVMSSGIEVGFYRFEDFCKHVLNISNTQAQNAIGLYEKFTVEEKGVCLKEEYKGYSVSQLIEMTSLPESARERIKPEMTVKEIREIKKELKQPESRVPSQDPLPGQISMTEITEKKIPTSEFSDEEAEEILRGFFHGSYGASIREICTSEKPIWQQADDLFGFFKKYGSAGYATDAFTITLSKGRRSQGDYTERDVSWLSVVGIYKKMIDESVETESEKKIPTSEFSEKAEYPEAPEAESEPEEREEESEPETDEEPGKKYTDEEVNELKEKLEFANKSSAEAIERFFEERKKNKELYAKIAELEVKLEKEVKKAKDDTAKLIFKEMYDIVCEKGSDGTIIINANDVKAIAKRHGVKL